MMLSNCRQRLQAIRDLRVGDVLFFGSYKKRPRGGDYDFVLDTVFVIRERFEYKTDLRFRRAAGVTRQHRKFVFDRIRDLIPADGFTLYKGAMRSERSTHFSWVPCKSAAGGMGQSQFSRPRINQLFGITEPNPRRAITELSVPTRKAWEKVTSHCLDLGLDLAVRVSLG